ncbi:MAG: PAS domain-containing protein [Paracoccaceae bacterium]|nr:PAS domain-containing protein [Paracoccaceae bacterium]
MTEEVEVMGTGSDKPRDGNVFSLERAPRRVQQIDQIERYWNKVRANRLVPSRCEIDPRGLEGVLGHAFILERIAGGLARFRIAGSHLTDLSGLELRQMPLSAIFLPGSREILSEALKSVFDEPAVVRMAITSPSGFGRPKLEGELILLPLRSDLGDVDRVLGGLVFEGQIGRTPRRIEIVGETRTSLTGYAGPLHRNEPAADLPPVARPDQARKRPVVRVNTEALSNAPERGHLRLVVSND